MAAPRLRGGRLRGGKGGNPKPIGGERKVQLIMFTYLALSNKPIPGWFIKRGIEDGFVDFVCHFKKI